MKIYECIISLFGGIGVFILAMNMMSNNLQQICGAKTRLLLARIADKYIICALMGAAVAAVIQSAAAVSVMSIGFVNTEIMNIPQATAVIMGANFGASLTGILASLQSLNLFIYFGFLTFIGVVLSFLKYVFIKYVGGIICGLGMIFIGLNIMNDSCKHDAFRDMMRSSLGKINFPLVLVLLGFIFTSLIQSASAMTGLIIVMVEGGSLDMDSALFLILGANVGTSSTALINTIGKNIYAKRTGIVHLAFNLGCTLVFTIITWILKGPIKKFLELMNSKPEMQIAWFNVFFKFLSSAMSLPLINILINLSNKILKGRHRRKNKNKVWKKTFKHIDKRYLMAPEIAKEQVKKEIKDMIGLSKKNFNVNVNELLEQNYKYMDEISIREDLMDYLNHEASKFLVKLSKQMKDKISGEMSNYFNLINNIVRICEYTKSISTACVSMKKKGVKFCESSISNLTKMHQLVERLFDLAMNAFENKDLKLADEFVLILEKFKCFEKEYIQNSYDKMMRENFSVSVSAFFLSSISSFNQICSHLENIIKLVQDDKTETNDNTPINKVAIYNSKKEDLNRSGDFTSSRKYMLIDIDNSNKELFHQDKYNMSIN